jgi:hypothetical protein
MVILAFFFIVFGAHINILVIIKVKIIILCKTPKI